MATVADVLARKGRRVLSVSPTATVLEATQLMNRHKVGALVVTEGQEELDVSIGSGGCDRVVGMFTERDVLTRVVVEQRDPARTLVEEVMTADVAYCRPDAMLEEVGAMMRGRRIRHLPVCDDEGQLRGLISIGDLNAWHADGQETEIHYLQEYIHGRV
jgi:CBS domain-containing protein